MKNLTFHIVGLTHNDVKGHEVEYAKEAEGRTICLVPDDANTFDMLAYCMNSWWERVGATKAAGITKLMMSEAGNFPAIAAFYQQEVIAPGHTLIRRILQRGMDRGEFRQLDLDCAVFSVLAPMIFIMLTRHSQGVCLPDPMALEPKRYIASQLDIILYGLGAKPIDAAAPHRKPDAA